MVVSNPKGTQPREGMDKVLRMLLLVAVRWGDTTARKENKDLLGLYRIKEAILRFSSLPSDVAKGLLDNTLLYCLVSAKILF